jgi:hypothetical protein
MTSITRSLVRTHLAALHLAERQLHQRMHPQGSGRPERGDVPGWVLITLMTAGLVTVLWAVAKDQLVTMFQDALGSVTG